MSEHARIHPLGADHVAAEDIRAGELVQIPASCRVSPPAQVAKAAEDIPANTVVGFTGDGNGGHLAVQFYR